MICNLLLSCSVLLLSCSHLLGHPVMDTAAMTYSGPDSVEEAGGVSPDDFSVSDLNDLLQRAAVVGYSPLLSRENIKVPGQTPKEALRELLLEKPYRLIPPSDLWGSRRQFRKRGGGADCFWKYCV
ncbi:prepro-urotensin II-alpha [Sinocyclocheilus anshuiensis]|uniref:Prepro-urotensin II-alpha n=1 Tax=Sinocyclocheilus anshuiensis TaxID=1608454 RepID=A0A671LGC5_9TELE|nr:PREDICTED: prepro-urotensin II-alpha [Sinocyclocheilus anshuiensis]